MLIQNQAKVLRGFTFLCLVNTKFHEEDHPDVCLFRKRNMVHVLNKGVKEMLRNKTLVS